eukprot:COSAG06_NODE_5829_length_3254_cov_1.361648_3_plen_94_part_00
MYIGTWVFITQVHKYMHGHIACSLYMGSVCGYHSTIYLTVVLLEQLTGHKYSRILRKLRLPLYCNTILYVLDIVPQVHMFSIEASVDGGRGSL